MDLSEWFDDGAAAGEGGGEAAGVFSALRRERIVFDPASAAELEELREDAVRIARGMDSPQHPPPMLWSGIPLPGPAAEVSCDYHLVISVGGTKTEFALLRLERGELLGLDLESGAEVSSPAEIDRIKDAVKMTTPVHCPSCPTGDEMVRRMVEHMSGHLEPHREAIERCGGILLSWGFASRTVRTGPRLLGGLAAIVTQMTKDQAGFQKDLAGKNIGELFTKEFERRLGWSPPVAVANDTVMALYYFLGPAWRPRFHRAGLFINGTGTNFATAEPYAVRPGGYISAPGEEYQPERLREGRELRPGETAVPFFVNYEAGSIELIGTRTRFDLEDAYQIERNALAGGNAYSQQLRELTRELIAPELHDRLRAGWVTATGGDPAADPGAPAVGKLSSCDGSAAAVAEIFGGATVSAGEARGLRLIARAIVDRSALHAALVLAAIELRTGFGRGGDGKPDLVGMEGSVWKIDGYRARVRGWWQALAGGAPLAVEFAHEPAFNASLPGPLYLAALHG